MSDYYATIGVTKTATEQEIKKAYRRLAMIHHPDKGGDPQKFNEISSAYEVLSNPDKRRLYDRGGMDAVSRGEDHGADMYDMFQRGGRRGGASREPRKGESVVFPFKLTLEEMYTGLTRRLRITRTICCSTCDGIGGSGQITCTPCQGRGVRVVVQRLGPGMISQSQATCDKCRGAGTVIPQNQICQVCCGAKVVKEKKAVDVVVPRGARSGQTTVITGEGDQLPGTLPGDIIIEFQQQGKSDFERKGLHLYYTQKISLYHALVGCSFYIKHLDGHNVFVKTTTVIKPGSMIMIEYEGMPCSYGPGRGIDTGNLYITFDVIFPETQVLKAQGNAAVELLSSVLPAQKTFLNLKPSDPLAQIVEAQPIFTTAAQQKQRLDNEEREWTAWQREQRATAQSSSNNDYDDDDGAGFAQPACQPM